MHIHDHHQEELRQRREQRLQRDSDARKFAPDEKQPPSEDRKFWDCMTAKDATKPGFWHWMCANETRFGFCLFFLGISGLTLTLLLVQFLQLIELTQPSIDKAIFVILLDALLVIMIALLIPIGVAYAISGKRKVE